MSTAPPDVETSRKLVALWVETGRILAEIRARELAAQTPEESQRAAFDMLQLGGILPSDPARETVSGLVEMQRRFSALRDRGRA